MPQPIDEQVVPAPERLGLETRRAFRHQALQVLDALPPGQGSLTIDLSHTVALDSTGLNALVLIRRHASDRRISVKLSGASDEVRRLLSVTKLDRQFAVDPGGR